MSKTVHPDNEFNAERFMELLRLAKGDRSQTKFASDCGLSTAYVCKLFNGHIKQVPLPSTLKKIGACAYGSVSTAALLEAAGYNASKYIQPAQLNNKLFIATLTSALAKLPYDWQMHSGNADLSIDLKNCVLENWSFYFIDNINTSFTSEHLYNYWGKIVASGHSTKAKFSLVTDSTEVFDKILVAPPLLLCAYSSAILIDTKDLSVVREASLKSASDEHENIPTI